MSEHEYGAVFAAWRRAAADDWTRYTTHAFVDGLADGSLPQSSFHHYLIQDYIFLKHFARAWALGVVKAASLEEMRAASRTVHALLDHEMPLHVAVCAELGMNEQHLFEAEEETENIAYSRYVMDTGLSGDFLDLLSVLAPCVLGYGEIGLRTTERRTSSAYADWMNTYAGKKYQDVCRSVGTLIDNATEKRLGFAFETNPRWSSLIEGFRKATRLEVGFWDMSLRGKA